MSGIFIRAKTESTSIEKKRNSLIMIIVATSSVIDLEIKIIGS